MNFKRIAVGLAAAASIAVVPSSAIAGTGVRDRAILLQPGTCATFFQDQPNQFLLAGTNSPIKWSGGIRSCSTDASTVHLHFEQTFDYDPIASPCVIPSFDSAPVTLRSGDTKGLSAQAPEPTCVGYYFLRVTVLDENGVNVSQGGGSLVYTVHVAAK